ncbi:STELLO glycosyltransferase family protein [Coleofasciculus sp. E1-EBD-02]|uniref:STELLO glycosyltransferase family protein n=1 Tax=Coleofasciculus sp. E1-EBD-02 TaxID=3068481 RepID=UPI00330249D9
MYISNKEKVAVVVTSIGKPNKVLSRLASESNKNKWDFLLIGDLDSPSDFNLKGCDFYSLERQLASEFKFAQQCPTRHYARKNIGYLLAIKNKASIIIETDDDNMPREEFWQYRTRKQNVITASNMGWINAYSYFTEANIWPRGFPLDSILGNQLDWDSFEISQVDCPIQQGLADGNPDVDAIYRLTLPLPQYFRKDRRLALAQGSWCPFNSQNTTWWFDAYPLLYLPAYCSFRMTDIWRSFIAQAIAWVNGWSVLFHEPTVWQDRNHHNLMKDFSQEIDGYLKNREICQTLAKLQLEPGTDKLMDNMRTCYESLVNLSVIAPEELNLLEAWLSDLESLA